MAEVQTKGENLVKVILLNHHSIYKALGIVLLLLLLWYASAVFLITFFSILFTIAFRTLINFVAEKCHCSDRISFYIVLPTLIILATFASWWLSSDIIEQIRELAKRLPEAINSFINWLGKSQFGDEIIDQAQEWDQVLKERSASLLSGARGILSTAVGFLSAIVVITFMTLFMSFNPDLYIRGIISLSPVKYESRTKEILDRLGQGIQWWLLGKLLSMTVIAVLSGIGLTIIGINLALALAIIAGTFAFIPYFGPLLSFLPAVLLALAESPTKALYVTALYAFIQFIEGNLLTPIIEKKTVHLPPALTLFAQVQFGLLFGFLGVVLASPLALVLIILVKSIYIEDYLGKINHE
ncbi:MAG: AI-2E family transporter [Oligoflexus sp.]